MKNHIIELSTDKGRLREGQFVTYKGDDEIQVYSIIDKETITAFYPSEDGRLIVMPIIELTF